MSKRHLLVIALSLILSVPAAYADTLQGEFNEAGTLPSNEIKTNKSLMDLVDPAAPPPPKKQAQPESETGKVGLNNKVRKGGEPLQGNIEQTDLSGAADDRDGDLKAGAGQQDPTKNPLKGKAELGDTGLASQDPDIDDQELQVEWDKWRNRFLWAVQSGVQEALNNPDDQMLRWDPQQNVVVMRFPLGTVAWFNCKVTNDRRIAEVKLMHSSGFPGYDKAVVNAVKSLEGTSILRFPKRSRRQFITQQAGIKTSDSGDRQFFHFGDVERYRAPAGGGGAGPDGY